VLVPVLVGLRLAGQLVLGEVVVHVGACVAAQAILHADLDPGVGQNMLDAGARHRAGREGVAFDYDGDLGQDRLNVQCLKSMAIQYAEVAEAAVGVAVEPVAKIVLAAARG